MARTHFEEVWENWHCSICSTAELTSFVLDQLIDSNPPEWLAAAAWICKQRLKDETENAPVPPSAVQVGEDQSNVR